MRIRQVAEGVLLEPFTSDPPKWFAELDRLNSEPFMKNSRNQPVVPSREIFK